MTGAVVNVMEIFKKYGLDVEQVEPVVYKVLNTDREISVDELQIELENCIIISSDKTGYKKLSTGISSRLAYVYYIVTDYDRDDLGNKYDDIATERFGESVYRYYKYRPEYANSIDTIYAKGEI